MDSKGNVLMGGTSFEAPQTVESGAMEADELLFLDLQRKTVEHTHTQKNSTYNKNIFGGTRNPRFY